MKNIKTKMRTIKDEFLYYEEFINRVYKDQISCALLDFYIDDTYKKFVLPLHHTKKEREQFLQDTDFSILMVHGNTFVGQIYQRS